MNKKMRELAEQIKNKKAEARAFLDKDQVAEAKALSQEVKNLQEQLDLETELYEEEKTEAENKMTKTVKNQESLAVQAFKNHVAGKPLTVEMQNALTTTDAGVLIPEELIGQITEERRQLVSLKDFANVIPVKSSKGSVPMEDLSGGLQMLVDFDEISDLDEQTPKFKNIQFALKNKGAITPVSNGVLSDTVGVGLQPYIVRDFVKKAVRSENADILAQIQTKAPKAFTNLRSIASSINKDIDPAAKENGVFITNQSGYDLLDGEVGTDGKPLLTASVTDPNIKNFKGLQVVVLSDAELPNVAGKAPVIFGSLKAGVMFFDREEYAVAQSSEAGFSKHQTLFKVTERYDAKVAETNAFVYGTLTLPA